MKKEEQKPSLVYRSIDNDDMKYDEEKRVVELSFASSFAVERYDWIEVLDMSGMDTSRLSTGKAALLVEHDRRDQVGVIESVWLDGDKARARVRFSKSARGQEIYQDVIDGIRSLVSVGYRINEVKRESTKDGVDTYRVSRWEPYEISIVSIPADPTVGIGRAADMTVEKPETEESPNEVDDVKTNDIVNDVQGDSRSEPISKDLKTESPKMDEEIKKERARASEILALGEKFNQKDAARSFIESGKSVDEFRAHLLDNQKAEPIKTSAIGMTEKEARSFSFLRLLDAMRTGDYSKAGFEREAVQAAEKALGRSARGAFIPAEVLMVRSDMTVGTPAAGGSLVATDLRIDSFIGALRSRLLVRAMGATVLNGLVGNLAIPKQTGLASVGWVGEDGTASPTRASFGQVPLSPKTVLAKTSISRRMMEQTDMSVEAWVRGELEQAIAKAVDRAALVGGGTNEPVGLLGGALGPGRKVIVGTDGLSWAEVVALETAVAAVDGDIGSMSYVTTPSIRGQLKTTEKGVGNGQYIWTDGSTPGQGMVNGYRAGATTQLTGAQDIIFGNFADLLIGFWSGTDVVVDQISDDSGAHIVKVYQDVDIAIRHANSFAYGSAT